MKRSSERFSRAVGMVVLSAAVLWSVAPLGWFIVQSFKSRADALAFPPRILFRPTLRNYVQLFGGTVPDDYTSSVTVGFPQALGLSFAVALLAATLAVLVGSPAGYALARMRRGRWDLLGAILGTRMLPVVIVVMPIFAMAIAASATDSVFGLAIVHGALGLPLVILVIAVQPIGSLERLREQASLDGLSAIRQFVVLVVPSLFPAILTGAMLAFLSSWNEFFFALVLGGEQIRTAPVVLAGFQTLRGVQWGLVAAASTAMIAPVVLLVFLLTRPLVWRSVSRPRVFR